MCRVFCSNIGLGLLADKSSNAHAIKSLLGNSFRNLEKVYRFRYTCVYLTTKFTVRPRGRKSSLFAAECRHFHARRHTALARYSPSAKGAAFIRELGRRPQSCYESALLAPNRYLARQRERGTFRSSPSLIERFLRHRCCPGTARTPDQDEASNRRHCLRGYK